MSRLRGIFAARSLRGRVHVAIGARLGRGVQIVVAPGGELRVGRGCRVGRRARLEARSGTIDLAAGCRVGERARLIARSGAIVLGEGASVGSGCTLIAHAGIAIGERARLGADVSVIDFEPVIEDSELPIRAQGVQGTAVRIGPDVVVEPRAAIGPGVTLASGAQVATGVVVDREGHG